MVMKRLMGVVVMIMGAAGLVSCSDEPPGDFTQDNRDGFLAACSQPLEDTRLIGEICQCVFDGTQLQFSDFAEFSAFDTELIENPDRPLPAEVTQVIADCVLEEADI